MVYTSRKRNFRRFIKTHNLKYYFAFLAMVLAIVAAVIVITRNNRRNKPSGSQDETAEQTESQTEQETDIPPETVRGIYRLDLNLATGQMAVYEWDADSEAFSEKAEQYMLFAARNVNAGEYAAPYGSASKSAWASSERKERFYRYSTSFGGKIIFHSPDYDTQGDKNSLIAKSYEAIKEHSADDLSDGITLTVADAKWIYENCSFESEIRIYSDERESAHETANRIIPIPEGITWEPTDSSNGTPWCQTEIAELSAPPVFELTLGAPETVVLGSAKALDKSGADVSKYVYFSGKYEIDKPGVYSLTYNLIDVFGNHLQQPLKLTVKEPETTPEETTPEPTTEITTESEPQTDESDTSGLNETESSEPDTSQPPQTDETSGDLPEPSSSDENETSGSEEITSKSEEETTEEIPPSSYFSLSLTLLRADILRFSSIAA